jgi:hypothetical protein
MTNCERYGQNSAAFQSKTALCLATRRFISLEGWLGRFFAASRTGVKLRRAVEPALSLLIAYLLTCLDDRRGPSNISGIMRRCTWKRGVWRFAFGYFAND